MLKCGRVLREIEEAHPLFAQSHLAFTGTLPCLQSNVLDECGVCDGTGTTCAVEMQLRLAVHPNLVMGNAIQVWISNPPFVVTLHSWGLCCCHQPIALLQPHCHTLQIHPPATQFAGSSFKYLHE